MSTDWNDMWDIFHAALDLPEAERLAYVDAACKGNAELAAEVRALLMSHDDADQLPEPDAFLADIAIDEELATASAGRSSDSCRPVLANGCWLSHMPGSSGPPSDMCWRVRPRAGTEAMSRMPL